MRACLAEHGSSARILVEVQSAVPAPEVEERVKARIEACLHYLPDENMMISAVINAVALALEYPE
jgi:hypothetical protein